MATWPAQLRPLVESHGVDAVFQTGLRVLGYPPNWCDRGSEFKAVREAVEREAGAAQAATQTATK